MITIKDMAKILGTSTTTVSNVIHGKTSEVSPEMVRKVQKIIDEYDYVPNINARNLAKNKSKIIGLAMKFCSDKYENFIKDPFGGEVTGAIERNVRARGYFTMLYISDVIEEIINSVASWNVDGLILMGIQDNDLLLLKKKFKKPMIFVDSYFQEGLTDYVNVGIQDRKGSYDITKYLISKGHRRIAFLADNCYGTDYERFMGYRDALLESDIEYKEEDFIMMYPKGDDLQATLYDVYCRSEEYTALEVASDMYAAQITNYFTDRGRRVPEDISIVGFDDNAYSRIVRPALTTVHQDISLKSEVAVDNLVKMIHKEEIKEKKISLPVELVIRDSVKDLN
jgi:LacI family transcriptional regulator